MNKVFIPVIAMASIALSTPSFAAPGQLVSAEQLVNNALEKQVWISIGSDAVRLIEQQKNIENHDKPIQLNNINNNTNETSIVSINSQQIDTLSEFMHKNFNRCGGFFYHESYEEALAFASTPAQFVPAAVIDYTLDNAADVDLLLSQLNANNLTSTVNSLSSFNNRYYSAQTGVDAATWVKDHWTSISGSRSDISVDFYNHSFAQSSVVATITGTKNADEIIIIGGHLDSINSSSPTNGRAPGADDNASGIAVITETLRAIVASGFKPERTIKVIGYAAEEVGLRGSKDIAQSFKASGKNVLGVAQFDMTGHNGTTNKDIVFMTDYTNNAQNQFMGQLIDTYLTDVTYGFDQCGYGCSDHASWHNEGYAASMPFESAMSDINNKIHTSNDASFDQNHGIKFAKLAAAYVAEIGKGGVITVPPPESLVNGVAKTGLSATTNNALEYIFEVPSVATDVTFNMSGGTGDADMYIKFGAAATDSVWDCRPYKNGNNETCTVNQAGGTYYVRLKAYSSFSGVSILGSYFEPGHNQPIEIVHENVSVAGNTWQRYTQELPAGYSQFSVSISGGSGDADLYVRKGAQSTSSAYDCRPFKNGNSESCSFDSPAADTWYIDLYGYSAASGVTLKITAQP